MPYIIRPPKLLNPPQLLGGAVAAFVAVLLFGAVSARADVSSPESLACVEPEFSQPFQNANDNNYYVLAPGQDHGAFVGTGWTFSGGAAIVEGTLPSGQPGAVLYLPGGSEAVSPAICVASNYPTARMLMNNVNGSAGANFSVAYEGTKSWKNPRNTGQVHSDGSSWAPSTSANMHPEKAAGWQHVKITLTGAGHGAVEVDNLYIDPYRR